MNRIFMGESATIGEGQALASADHGVGNSRITHLRKAVAKKYVAPSRGLTVTGKVGLGGARRGGVARPSAF